MYRISRFLRFLFILLIVLALFCCSLSNPPRFTVGGTLSGLLEGNSIVLTINGDEDLTITQDGSFIFPTGLLNGTVYTVTAKQQPQGQRAVIKNGTGVISGKHISNLEVTASTNTFSIGGSVTGLDTGESFTLLLNGGNELTITENGAYGFAEELAYNTNYAVTVGTEPVSQEVILDNSSGTVPASDIVNITATCQTRTYTVGGTVSGLESSETVVLSLNNGENYTVSSNGSFTFPETLLDGDAYTVTVESSPTDKVTIDKNTAGFISNSDIDTVEILVAKEVIDDVSSSAAWSGLYYIPANTEIDVSGGTLSIGPDTTIIFGSNAGLDIRDTGSLTADGGETSPIVFTGEEQTEGYWNGINFFNSNSTSNILDYVTIEYGGGTDYSYSSGAANIQTSINSGTVRLSVSNTTLSGSAGYGFSFDPDTILVSFTGNTITSNNDGAGILSADDVNKLDATNSYSGNTADYVYIIAETVNTNQTWNAINIPYRIGGTNTNLSISSALSIEAGTIIECMQGVGITVGETGSLNAVGSADSGILFRGTSDTTGYWMGLSFLDSNNESNVLDYVTIQNGGEDDFSYVPYAACLTAASSGNPVRVTVTNCILEKSGGYGFLFDDNSDISGFSSNIMRQNTSGAGYLHAESVLSLDTASSYTGNTKDIVYVDVGSPIDVSSEWQAIGVPYVLGPDGDDITVNNDLVLNPGVILQFSSDSGLEVGSLGSLNAVGTGTDNSEQILFTGVSAENDYWRGIYFINSKDAKNNLKYCRIEYTGSSYYSYTDSTICAIAIASSGDSVQAEITDCIIADTTYNGIWIDTAATYNTDIETNNTFEDVTGTNVIVEQ